MSGFSSKNRFVIVIVWGYLTLFLARNSFCLEHLQTKTNPKLLFWSVLRFRYEYQNNFNIKSYGDDPAVGEKDDGFLMGRLRAGFRYIPFKNLLLSLGIQHSVVWDLALEDEDFYNKKFRRQHNPYEDKWEPFETYIELRDISSHVNIKAGRQLIYYGDKRIFGPGTWGNSGKWIWDAVKTSYRFRQGFVDVFYGRTIIHDPDVLSIKHRHGFESFGMYSHFTISASNFSVNFEPFAMTKRDDHNHYKSEDGVYGDLDTYYIGGRFFVKDFYGFDFDMTYVRQKGDYSTDDIDSYGYHILFGYHLKDLFSKPFISAEYSFASGDSDPTDGKHETFDGAFGARDKMYGRMNLFKWSNLKDAQLNFEFTPHKKVYVKTEFHKFWLAEERDAWYLNPRVYRDKTGQSGDEVGREFDLVIKVDLPYKNQIQMGYGHFWPDEFAKKLASDTQADWVFIQWKIKFSKGIL